MRMKIRHLLFLAGLLLLAACKEDIDTSARYVFKDYTVYSYLEKYPQYSEYAKILSEVKASSMSNKHTESPPYGVGFIYNYITFYVR